MNLVTVTKAVKLTGISDSGIRNYLDNGTLTKYENEKGLLAVDKYELLKLIPTVITVFNQKGGCGKTSLSVLLSDYYEKKGFKTLLIDFDQQGNLSQTFFPYDDLRDGNNIYHYFHSNMPINKILRKYNDSVDIIPATIKLSRIGNLDVPELTEKCVDFQQIFKKYQIVIIDCPPAINSFSKFGLLLSNYVLIPVVPEAYDFDGLFEVMNSINLYKKFIEKFIDFRVIISRHDQRNTIVQETYSNKIRAELKNKVIEDSIPSFVGIKERATQIGGNIFNMYQSQNKSLKRIIGVLDGIHTSIYDERRA